MCRTCDVLECVVCKNYHDNEHQSSMLRFICVQWNKNMESDVTKCCSSCSKLVRSRFECTQCEKSLCNICCEIMATNDAWFDEHDPSHKLFRSIVPPNFSVPEVLTRTCRCVEDPNVMMHCSRCVTCKCTVQISRPQDLTIASSQTWQYNLLVHHMQKHLRCICEIVQKVLSRRTPKAPRSQISEYHTDHGGIIYHHIEAGHCR